MFSCSSLSFNRIRSIELLMCALAHNTTLTSLKCVYREVKICTFDVCYVDRLLCNDLPSSTEIFLDVAINKTLADLSFVDSHFFHFS